MNKPVPLVGSDTGRARPITRTASIRKGQAFQSPSNPNNETGDTSLLGIMPSWAAYRETSAEARRYAGRVVLEPTPKLRRGDVAARCPREGMASRFRRHPKTGSVCAKVAPKVMRIRAGMSLDRSKAFLSYARSTWFTKGHTGFRYLGESQ